jgi:hypothetical protein
MFISSISNAQYKINKTKYDYRTYSYQAGDKYNPTVAGVTSFILPGLGQMLSGEGGRGAVLLGGYLICGTVFVVGVNKYFDKDDILNPLLTGKGTAPTIIGGIGTYTIIIVAIVDAVRVAKVNNLAWRDKNKTSYSLQIQPYINTTYYKITGSIPAGVTFKVTY